MRSFTPLWTALVSTLCLSSVASAHSRAREALRYITTVDNAEIHTHNRRVHAHQSFDLTFDLHEHTQRFRLTLEPNHDILDEHSQVQFLDHNGHVKSTQPIARADHKVYLGEAYEIETDGTNTHVGWTRITVRRDGASPLFEGVFTRMGDHHHIELSSAYLSAKHPEDPELELREDDYMTMYRDSDIGPKTPAELRRKALDDRSCAADSLEFNTDPQHPIYRELARRNEPQYGAMSIGHLFEKRQDVVGNGNSAGVNLRSTIGDTTGCPTSRKVALIGVAVDCNYVSSFSSLDTMRQHVISVVNSASDLYQATFNITLGLRNLTVSERDCPATPSAGSPWNIACSDSTTITQRLNTFSSWRGTRGDTNAYWSLFTTCNTGAEVGLAWLGQLCNHGATSQSDTSGATQAVTGANVVCRTQTSEWQVFAHETGHTFGAVHDCDSSVCANQQAVSASRCCPLSQTACDAGSQYLMNPFSRPGITKFSPCSIGNVCSALGRNSVQSNCLTDNRGVVTITGQQCGNGIVEAGEDCDCGGPAGCAGNPCCDPTTCKFTTNSVCDPSNDGCCTRQCQYQAAGTVCRASTGQCDPQEVCTGTNATCPADQTAKDGTNCGNNLQCVSGQCTSRDQQCKTAMGSYTQGNDTYSCNSQTCQITCGSPDFGFNVCYSLQQNFLDGTACGGGGHCENGVCRGTSTGGEIKSWINDNKTTVIAVASAIGGFLLLAILGCCCGACRRRRRSGPKRKAVPPPRTTAWSGPPVPPQMVSRGYGGGGQNPNSWHGQGNNFYPAMPPASYSGTNHGYSPGGPIVRYA